MTIWHGQVELTFHQKAHKYEILDRNRPVKCTGVTTACGILAKPALIQWSANKAVELCQGAILPNELYSEIYLEQVWDEARKAHRIFKEQAATTGTLVHAELEAFFNGVQSPHDSLPLEAQRAVDAAKWWLNARKVEPVAIERRIYSRKHKYVGTLDKIATVDGILSLIDWKSSKSIHSDYWLQTAAYVKAWEEENPAQRIEKRYLLHLDKETGEGIPYVRKSTRELNRDYQAFLSALKLHNWSKGQ